MLPTTSIPLTNLMNGATSRHFAQQPQIREGSAPTGRNLVVRPPQHRPTPSGCPEPERCDSSPPARHRCAVYDNHSRSSERSSAGPGNRSSPQVVCCEPRLSRECFPRRACRTPRKAQRSTDA
jgi:hypothetical protein